MNQYNNPKKSDWKSLVKRPYVDNSLIYETVIDVFRRVKDNGDVSLRELTKKFDKEKDVLLEKLVFRINSVLRAKRSKYILMNVPNDKIKAVSNLLPVLKSPTVLPLEIEGWSSLHTVIDDDKFWESIDSIKEAGAEDILVCPIEKMVR